MNLQFQSLLPSLHTQSHLPQRGRQQGMYNFFNYVQIYKFVHIMLGSLAEGAVIRELQSKSPFKE